MLGGMGSEAISAVPILANTRSTSGTLATCRSSSSCIAMAWVRLVPGIRSTCTARSPSSRLGMNSAPSRVATASAKATATAPKVSTTGVLASERFSSGSYSRRAPAIRRFSFSCTRPSSSSATAAGTKVIDRIIAPSSASTTVIAMGWNIFPSTPVRAKIGR